MTFKDSVTGHNTAINATDFASHTRVTSSDVLAPENNSLPWQIVTSGAVAQDTVDISGYQMGVLVVSGLTTETISLRYLMNSTPVVSDPIMVRRTDGTFAAAAALANGTYYIPLACKNIRLTKSAAVETVTATFLFKQTGNVV